MRIEEQAQCYEKGKMGKEQNSDLIPLYKVHIPSNIGNTVDKLFQSAQIANGPNVERFETMFQDYIGNPYITTTGDISSSITLCLSMAGVRPGDEVIASPMACLATNEPILNLFAKACWCDIDPLTGNIDPEDLKRISPRTKAILLYHWAGNPADLDAVYQIAKANGLSVIEDAGEALGAEYKGRKIGNTGADYTVFSFYPNRHITTIEGAAIAFNKEEDYKRARWLKRYGIHTPSFRDRLGEIDPASDIPMAGYNTYMNNISAGIGVAQMVDLHEIVAKHQANGRFYDEALCNIPGISLLNRVPDTKSAFWVYTLLSERRDDLLAYLRDHGVYASKVHLRNDIYTCFGSGRKEDLEGVNEFSQKYISIPCGWWVSDEEKEYIVEIIRQGW